MPKAKTIRVSDDTIEKLGEARNGFETPDECINRMLSDNPCKENPPKEDEDGE